MDRGVTNRERMPALSPMETFILIVSLLAAAGGTLVLLACLAGKRAELLDVFTAEEEREARRRTMESGQTPSSQARGSELPVVS